MRGSKGEPPLMFLRIMPSMNAEQWTGCGEMAAGLYPLFNHYFI
jgi:hypothetical protein